MPRAVCCGTLQAELISLYLCLYFYFAIFVLIALSCQTKSARASELARTNSVYSLPDITDKEIATSDRRSIERAGVEVITV